MAKVITDEKLVNEILTRGVAEVVVEKDLRKLLLSGKRIKLYLGIDPTGGDLHLGHSIPLRKLQKFMELGHEVVFLVGDFTAKIGDPSERDSARVPLTNSQIKDNLKTYKKQASKILDFDKVTFRHNSQWLGKLSPEDFLKLGYHFTVQQMIERDMFRRRIKKGDPVSITEFLYPLLQGYDSVAMDVDLEVGSTDQLFNMLAGRTLQKTINKRDKHVLTTELIEGLDGRKMSKSYNNYIAILDTPQEMFGKTMKLNDKLIIRYFELLTNKPLYEIAQIKSAININPMDAKKDLARELVTMYHSKAAAIKAQKEFKRVHSDRKRASNPTKVGLSKEKYPLNPTITEVLMGTASLPSVSEAKRQVSQGSVEVEDVVVENPKERVDLSTPKYIRVGKKKFYQVERR